MASWAFNIRFIKTWNNSCSNAFTGRIWLHRFCSTFILLISNWLTNKLSVDFITLFTFTRNTSESRASKLTDPQSPMLKTCLQFVRIASCLRQAISASTICWFTISPTRRSIRRRRTGTFSSYSSRREVRRSATASFMGSKSSTITLVRASRPFGCRDLGRISFTT